MTDVLTRARLVPDLEQRSAGDLIHSTDRLIASGLLKPEHAEAVVALSAELRDAWEKRQVFRTETEMRVSVLNDHSFPTPSSKYWQAVREQANMLDNLAMQAFDFRRNEVQRQKIMRKLETETDPLEIESLQIDLDECNFKAAQLQQQANDRMREIQLWEQIKAELNDGSFNTQDRNASQLEELHAQLQARYEALRLSATSSQAEITNVIGPLSTVQRHLKQKERVTQ